MRARNTGSVSYRDGHWHAYPPNKKDCRARIGVYDFRFQAEAALDRWLEENVSKVLDDSQASD